MTSGDKQAIETQYPDDSLPRQPSDGTTGISTIELPADFACFDIETGPLPDDELMKICPPAKLPKEPGKFDPSEVKLGALKDEKKIKAKMDDARAKHELAVETYEDACLMATEQNFLAFRDKAALDATTGRVVAIGFANPFGIQIFGDIDNTEEGILIRFWGAVENCLKINMPMIGFNHRGFDLPFLVRRSMILGVQVPSSVRVGRYWNDLFVDLMECWNLGERGYVKLDTLCSAFGLPNKVSEVDGVEVSGATFHLLWESDRRVAKQYLKGDIMLPVELARQMGVV